jgi:tRNA threonylcarbamoyladenosine biosynthesis protein TsaB
LIVLGIDTAGAATSVALRLPDGATIEGRDDPVVGAHPGHATKLLGLASDLLIQAGIGWAQLQRIAVGAGPGTFTGLRVGVATARGLAQSLSVELLAVSSPRALAHAVLSTEPPEPGAVLAAIDARRGEIFAAVYDSAERELIEPRALAPEAVEAMLSEAGLQAPLGIGDGAIRYRAQLEAAGVRVPGDASGLHLLRASAVCALAAQAGSAPGYQEVLPDYRRRPDAELAAAGGAGR